EIGDLPMPSQAALLRALEEREVRPVGASTPVRIDVRFLAASHARLPELVAQGRFRDDLASRLSGFRFALPPLRDRREDIGILTAKILTRLFPERADAVAITPAAALLLFRYAWPHNVRELRRTLERALTLAPGGIVEPRHLPPELTGPVAS